MTLGRKPWVRGACAPWPVHIAAVAMVVDALLLIAHVLHRSVSVLDVDTSSFLLFHDAALWNGRRDGSLIESFGIVQLGAAAILFLGMGLRSPAYRVLAAWGGIFLLLIVDDLFRFHERVGAGLALDRTVPSLSEEAAQEVGGLAFWAASGLVLAGGLIRLHRTSALPARSASTAVLAIVVPFVTIAVIYVLFSAVATGAATSAAAEIVASVRMTMKLLTMTMLFSLAVRLGVFRPGLAVVGGADP